MFDKKLTEPLDDTNLIIDDFNSFGVEDKVSDMPQWDTWDLEYGDEKTTPTETEYRNITEEPCPEVKNIGSFDK